MINKSNEDYHRLRTKTNRKLEKRNKTVLKELKCWGKDNVIK
jgi:hypothetical protein